MKRLLVIAIALCATEAMACSSTPLCEGAEKAARQARETYLDMQHNADVQRQSRDALSRDLDAMERSSDQLFTDSLIMRLDRR